MCIFNRYGQSCCLCPTSKTTGSRGNHHEQRTITESALRCVALFDGHLLMHHDLKTPPCYFDAVIAGHKRHEIRYDRDRGFQRGDTITLREYATGTAADHYTGRVFHASITYVSTYEQKEGFCVFSFCPSNAPDDRTPTANTETTTDRQVGVPVHSLVGQMPEEKQ
jgi:hypothetical protein